MRNLLKRILNYSALAMFLLLIGCGGENGHLSTAEGNRVKDDVTNMANDIAKDVSAKGSTAWLNYFENVPGFFMASNGAVVFENYDDGRSKIIKSVSRTFSKIALTWKNYKIDPLDQDHAGFGADFNENIVLVNGQKMTVSGYVTALTHFDGTRWRIRNMNWAIRQLPPGSK